MGTLILAGIVAALSAYLAVVVIFPEKF